MNQDPILRCDDMASSEDAFTRALSHLPHGPEFRFLDRLTQLDPGHSGAGQYLVRGDEPFLRGHFPGAPLFPGVLLVEACAQLAGVIAQSDPHHPPLRNLKLTALRQVKILGSGVPGQILCLEGQIVKRMSHLIQATAAAHVGDHKILDADLILSGDPPV